MNINTNDSLVARKEITIEFPAEQVWQVLTDLERWPEWQSDISSISLNGNLTKGSKFNWVAKGLKIESTLQDIEVNKRIGWTGSSLGMKAIHIWILDPRNNGTIVTTEESLSGWFPRLLKFLDPNFLEKSLYKSLQALKIQVESLKGKNYE